jgi:hypothetical protein
LRDAEDRECAEPPGLEAAYEITDAPTQTGGEREQNRGQ